MRPCAVFEAHPFSSQGQPRNPASDGIEAYALAMWGSVYRHEA